MAALLAAFAAAPLACSRASDAPPPTNPREAAVDSALDASDAALRPGTYAVRSGARFRGGQLALRRGGVALGTVELDALLTVPPPAGAEGAPDAYTGGVSLRGDTAEMHTYCRSCRAPEAIGGYAERFWNGKYRVRAIGGGQVELREFPRDNPRDPRPLAVDTLERAGR